MLIAFNFIPDRRSSNNCMGTAPFFTVCEPLAPCTHKVIEHSMGREQGPNKLRVSMEYICALVAYDRYIIFNFLMCQKRQCIQTLLYLYQQTTLLVDTLPEEEIPFSSYEFYQ